MAANSIDMQLVFSKQRAYDGVKWNFHGFLDSPVHVIIPDAFSAEWLISVFNFDWRFELLIDSDSV